VRIAPKAAPTTDTTTPHATSGKSSGASFLDILAMGSGADFLGVAASSGSNTQTGSGGQSDPTQTQSESSLPPSMQSALDAAASTVSSPAGSNPAQDPSNGAQDAARVLVGSQTASHPTGKTGKQQAQPTVGTVVDASIAVLAQRAPIQEAAPPPISVPAPASSPAELTIASQAPSSSTKPVDALISGSNQAWTSEFETSQGGANQTVSTQDGQQLVDASQPANSRAQQNTAPQIAANAAQILQNSFAAIQPAAAQAFSLDSSENSAVGASTDASATNSNDGSAAGTQGSNEQAGRGANLPVASTFLAAAILPNNLNVNQLAGKANQFKTSASTFNSNSSLSSAAPATSTAKVGLQDAQGTSSHSSQSGSDAAQHGSADASQTNAVAAKPSDNGASQPIAFATVAATHPAAPLHAATDSIDSTPRHSDESAGLPSEQLNGAGTGTTSVINTARLIQSMSETEMRVGMRSTEFGDISIRTLVSQQQMQAQISVDHSELSNAISAHIPSIQAKLDNQYGLHASIEVSHGGASFTGERGQNAQKDQRAFTPSVQIEGTVPVSETDRMVLRVPSVAVVSDRLDIRA
jgi:hypothetical protein